MKQRLFRTGSPGRPVVLLFRFLAFALRSLTAQRAAYWPHGGRTPLRAGTVLDVHTGRETPDSIVIVQADPTVGVATSEHAGMIDRLEVVVNQTPTLVAVPSL